MKLAILLGLLIPVVSFAAPLKWVGWSDAHFAQAKKENRLVILDLQAIWCHWCHVMEETTYRDPKVTSILVSRFITIQVDQDSRPDIANRYQDYGWPATIIFNSSGKEIAKRSGYIRPDAMVKLLEQVVAHPNRVLDEEESVSEVTGEKLDTTGLEKQLTEFIESNYDDKLGGWKQNHKQLDLGMIEYDLTGKKTNPVKQTLDAHQALIDPVWGGVYQYSTGGNWKEPHFEKIMSVQADSISAYAYAYSYFKDEAYLKAAKKVQNYVKAFLTAPAGAFYTSQDADVVQGEHAGDFFQLSDEARRKKGVPRVDQNIYSRENGWMIQALASLYSATGEKEYLDQAVRAADWIIKNRSLVMSDKKGGFRHAEKDQAGPYLNDTLSMANAFLHLYIATGQAQWLEKSVQAARFIDSKFLHRVGKKSVGYVTAVSTSKFFKGVLIDEENVKLGRFANLLFQYTGKKQFLDMAKNAMNYLESPGVAEGLFVAPSFILLSHELKQSPLHITVVGSKADAEAQKLHQAAQAYPNFYRRIEWWDPKEGAQLNADVKYPELKKPAAFVCTTKNCGLPAFKVEDLLKQLKRAN